MEESFVPTDCGVAERRSGVDAWDPAGLRIHKDGVGIMGCLGRCEMKVLRVFGNYNPSGIVINEGWIALAACVYGDITVEEALRRVCCVKTGGNQRWQPGRGKSEMILQMHKAKPKMSNSEIARQVGCTRENVRLVLLKNGMRARRGKPWELCGKKRRKAE